LRHSSAPALSPIPVGPPAIPSPSNLHDIATHPRLWRYIPADLWPKWQDTCRPFLQDFRKASQSSNNAARSDALIAILMLPQKALIRSRGGKGRATRSLAS